LREAHAAAAALVAVHLLSPLSKSLLSVSLEILSWNMPPKLKKVRETFNALGVTGGAPKFKKQAQSTRKPTSWERKALKAAIASESEQTDRNPKIVNEKPRAPYHQIAKQPHAVKAEVKRPQRIADVSSSSSASGSSDDHSSDDASSSDEQSDVQPKSKAASVQDPTRTKKTKKEKIVSITFEHFPVEERDFHGISVSATRTAPLP
jgi:hypothetical protein